jgi:hypothetical protein
MGTFAEALGLSFAAATVAYWVAGKVKGYRFAQAYAFLVQLVGAYSASFVVDMLRLCAKGELQLNAVIFPAFTWTFFAGAAFIAAKRVSSSAALLASPYALIALVAGVAGMIHVEHFVTAFFVVVIGTFVYGLSITLRA